MKNANYYTMMEEELKKISDSGSKKKLLLHCCCAPCSSHCLEVLTDYFDITAYFYNPNITSDEEYEKRWNELKRFVHEVYQENGVESYLEEHESERFLEMAKGMEEEPERGYGAMPVISFVWIKVQHLQRSMDLIILLRHCRSVRIKMQTGSMRSEKNWVSSMV